MTPRTVLWSSRNGLPKLFYRVNQIFVPCLKIGQKKKMIVTLQRHLSISFDLFCIMRKILSIYIFFSVKIRSVISFFLKYRNIVFSWKESFVSNKSLTRYTKTISLVFSQFTCRSRFLLCLIFKALLGIPPFNQSLKIKYIYVTCIFNFIRTVLYNLSRVGICNEQIV